jgi:hypothetical protein
MNWLLFLDLIAWVALASALLEVVNVWLVLRDPDQRNTRLLVAFVGEGWAVQAVGHTLTRFALLPTLWFISRFFS